MIDGRCQRQPANDLLKTVPAVDVTVKRGKRLIEFARLAVDSAEWNEGAATAGFAVPETGHQLLGFQTGLCDQPFQTFNVARGDGAQVLTPRSVRVLRDFVIDPDALIGTIREEEVLYVEMRRDAADRVLRQVEAALR